MPVISIVVAASTNDVIGVQGKLPWKLSDDLRRFKSLTMGKPIVMGRLTWESIGRPLPGRQNIVISRHESLAAEGCVVVASPAAALTAAGDVDEIMIIGGGQIYELFLPKAERVYMTRVSAKVADGDASFPALGDDWVLVDVEPFAADEANEFAFEFQTFQCKARTQAD